MTAVTLDDLKSAQTKFGEMIAQFEAQARNTISLPQFDLVLAVGERYAGIALNKDGVPSHHLVLLAGEAESVGWESAKTWAASIGGELPTRSEQALLYANLKEQFQPKYYWSAEQLAGNSGYAWGQGFDDGSQDNSGKSYEGRARAVRRLTIL